MAGLSQASERLARLLGVEAARLRELDPAVADTLSRRLEELEAAAATDELTGLLRRGTGLAALEREVRRAQRQGDDRLTVAFVDVRSLKAVNDRDGHAGGDALLQALALSLRQGLRAYDVVVRWGGDEFVVGLVADRTQAEAIMARLAESFVAATAHHFDVGMAQPKPGESPADLIARADADLYERRRGSGRER